MRMLTSFLVRALWNGLNDPIWLRPSISTALTRPRRPKQYCLQSVICIYILGWGKKQRHYNFTPTSLFRDYSLTHV